MLQVQVCQYVTKISNSRITIWFGDGQTIFGIPDNQIKKSIPPVPSVKLPE